MELTRQYLFQFFDTIVLLETDLPAYLEPYVQMYARFRLEIAPPQSVDLHVLFTAERDGQPYMEIGGKRYRLPPSASLDGHTYGFLLSLIWRHVRSHLLIHAGAVAYKGQGVLLVADAMHGKSTLTLALVQRGASFLSDEIAALELTDGFVYPYPRRFSLRSGTLERLDLMSLEDPIQWFGNIAVDIDAIRPHALSDPVPLRYIFFLQDNPPHQKSPVANVLQIWLNEMPLALFDAIQSLPGVELVRVVDCEIEDEHTVPSLLLSTPKPNEILGPLQHVCQEHDVLLLNFRQRFRSAPPQFASQAAVRPLATSASILSLLSQIQNDMTSALLRDVYAGDSSRLFWALAPTLQDVACYQMQVGPLAETIDLLWEHIQ